MLGRPLHVVATVFLGPPESLTAGQSVVFDHLGVGDSAPEICDVVRIEDIAAANDVAVQKISPLLRQGDAVSGYPPSLRTHGAHARFRHET